MRVLAFLRARRDHPSSASLAAPLGECDAAALKAASRFGAFTVLTAGTDADDAALRVALAAGAKRAVRIPLEASRLDYLSVAKVLASAAIYLGFDLALCGARSSDESLGALGPAIAELAGVPHLSDVLDPHPTEAANTLEMELRRSGNSRRVRLRLRLPVLLCVTGAVLTSNLPSQSGAAGRHIELLDARILGLDPAQIGVGANVDRLFQTDQRATSFEDAAGLVAHLREDRLL